MQEKIHISSYDKYMESENWRRNWISENRPAEELIAHDKRVSDHEKERQNVLKKFPYSVILAGFYHEHDFFGKWCWNNIGIRDGRCYDGQHSEHTGCPFVLATECVVESSWKDKEGNQHYWKGMSYKDVKRHCHKGNWSFFWIGKTGYDYGLGEYCFSTERHLQLFVEKINFLSLDKCILKGHKMDEVFESKFGFHPCNRENYQKLRKLHAAYHKALSSAASWSRWERKQPHNRIIRKKIYDQHGRVCGYQPVLDSSGNPVIFPEPKICPVFCRKVTLKVNYDSHGNWVANGIDREFVEVEDYGIILATKQAKIPVSSRELVKPLSLTVEQIDYLLKKLS